MKKRRQEKRGAQCVLVREHLFNREPCRCCGQHRNRERQTDKEDDIHLQSMHTENIHTRTYTGYINRQ